MSGFWFFPPSLWFSSPRCIASHYKIYDFLPSKAIKQCIWGLNSVKLCLFNQSWWFGTAKSYIFPKFSFFLCFPPFFPFPISKPFDFFPSIVYRPDNIRRRRADVRQATYDIQWQWFWKDNLTWEQHRVHQKFETKQGRRNGYPSRVRVGRGCIWGHIIIWAEAVRQKTAKNKKK